MTVTAMPILFLGLNQGLSEMGCSIFIQFIDCGVDVVFNLKLFFMPRNMKKVSFISESIVRFK